jgi:hypothetical protein
MNRLPNEWKYSMAARIRRERKQDRAEEERSNLQVALHHSLPSTMVVLPAFELEIRIEAELGVSPATWTLKTKLIESPSTIMFIVPDNELQRIPYPPNTRVRLVPCTRMHILRPSNWFIPGLEPSGDFSSFFRVGCHATGIFHIDLTLPEDIFATLVSDLIMGQFFGATDGFHLLMLAED